MKIIKFENQFFIDEIDYDGFKRFNVPLEQHTEILKDEDGNEIIQDDFLAGIDTDLLLRQYNNKGNIKVLRTLRSKKTTNIKVPLNDIELDGDELSQERMARAITTLNAKESTIWIDAAGEPQELTKEDLKKALKLAGQKQTEIFIEYAQKKAELLAA